MSNEQPDIRLQMLSNTHFLAGARELLGNLAKRLGFSDEAAGHISLATDEALCNVIRHGYDKAPDKPIWINIFVLGGPPMPPAPVAPGAPDAVACNPTTGLKIVIEDEAKQVDLSKIKSRDLDEVRPGGLGVHIINEVMDSATYEHRVGGKGMRLTMIKNRKPASTPASPSCTPNDQKSCPSCGDRP